MSDTLQMEGSFKIRKVPNEDSTSCDRCEKRPKMFYQITTAKLLEEREYGGLMLCRLCCSHLQMAIREALLGKKLGVH